MKKRIILSIFCLIAFSAIFADALTRRFLATEIEAVTTMTLNNESITAWSEASGAKFKISPNDTTPSEAINKIIGSSAIVATETGDGGNETLVLTVPASGIVTTKIADNNVTLAKLAHGTGDRVFGLDNSGVPVVKQIGLADLLNEVLPTGIILLWSGSTASIPTGWTICDGTLSTPDLRSSFVVGASASGGFAVDATGGSNNARDHTLLTSEMPAHTHTQRAHQQGGAGTSNLLGNSANNTSVGETLSTGGGGAHNHGGTDGNMPLYYALAYIMKT